MRKIMTNCQVETTANITPSAEPQYNPSQSYRHDESKLLSFRVQTFDSADFKMLIYIKNLICCWALYLAFEL